ncbi:MAG: cation diffusion facilitator family transporter [bacterium]
MNTQRKKLGYLEGLISTVLNIILFILKLWIGITSNSVAMVADAWHTLSDSLTSVVVLIGTFISGKPGDREHPFGHGRAELVGAVIIATLLGLVGFNFIKDSCIQLKNGQLVHFNKTGIIIFSLSVILKESLARFSIWAGRKTHSRILIADGWHHRSDAIASLIIVVGAFAGKFLWWIDGVLGLLVSILILYAAFDILRDASSSILGEKADTEIESKINRIIEGISPDIYRVHHLHIHRYGGHSEITLHLKMDGDKSLQEAHNLASVVEDKIRKELCMEPTIHFEPRL